MVMRSFSAKVMLFAAAFAGILVQAPLVESGQKHKGHSHRSSNILPFNARPPVVRQFTSTDGHNRNRYYRDGGAYHPYSKRFHPARYYSSRFEGRGFRSSDFRGYRFRPSRYDLAVRYRDRGPIVYGGDPLIYDNFSQLPNIGTYVGGISAYPVPGNGIYFNSYGGNFGSGGYGYFGESPPSNPENMLAPKARIINVTAESPNYGCSFEAGVCVIRPGP